MSRWHFGSRCRLYLGRSLHDHGRGALRFQCWGRTDGLRADAFAENTVDCDSGVTRASQLIDGNVHGGFSFTPYIRARSDEWDL